MPIAADAPAAARSWPRVAVAPDDEDPPLRVCTLALVDRPPPAFLRDARGRLLLLGTLVMPPVEASEPVELDELCVWCEV